MTNKIELYYSSGACSLAPRLLITELNLDCKYTAVDLKTKKTSDGKNFLDINPKGPVPTLVLENKEILTENAVILQYLADRHNATHLLPPVSDFKRYRVLEWLNYLSSDWHKGFSALFSPQVPDDLKQNVFLPLAKKRAQYLSDHLANHTYLSGDTYTLPDMYLFTTLRWLTFFGIDLAKEYSHLDRYFQQVSQIKSVQKALEEDAAS